MKRLFIVLLVLFSFKGFAQTFKITAIATSENIRYPEEKEKYLNKDFKVTFNENSVAITPTTKNEPLVLTKKNATTYSLSTRDGDTNRLYMAVFKTEAGVVSSMEFTLSNWFRTGVEYKDYVMLTGKRSE